MPRLSADEVAAAGFRTDGKPLRLVCRLDAPQAVREAFLRIVESVDTTHFAAADAPLIERYAEAVLQAERAAAELEASGAVVNGKVSPWLIVQEKAHRAAVALAGKLRLSPVSRMSADRASTTARVDGGSISAGYQYLQSLEVKS